MSTEFQPIGNPLVSERGLERIADIDPRLTRTNYFDGRLLTAEDLTRDQIYLDQRLREVGQTMGHGVMQGLELGFDTVTTCSAVAVDAPQEWIALELIAPDHDPKCPMGLSS